MLKMKSIFFGLLILITRSIYGQTNKFDIGIEGSPSLIFLRGNETLNNLHKPTIGFSSGLFFQYNLKKVISFRTNVTFERKGSVLTLPTSLNNGNPTGKLTTHINFNYLTFPILVRATFGNKIQYFVNAGPYFGYLIKQTSVSRGDNTPKRTYDNTSQDKLFDTGVSAGIGLYFPFLTKFAASFEIRNNLGLYNVSAVPITNNGTVKTNSTNLIFSFTYKLRQKIDDTPE
jgi:hypothetical protein